MAKGLSNIIGRGPNVIKFSFSFWNIIFLPQQLIIEVFINSQVWKFRGNDRFGSV